MKAFNIRYLRTNKRGFESPPHRHHSEKSLYASTGFFLLYSQKGGDENPRPGFDNWRQPVGQTESEANRLPAGRAQRVNPPLTAIFEMRARTKVRAFFFWIATRGFAPWNSRVLHAWWRCAYQAYGQVFVGRVSAAPPDKKPAQKTKPGFPGLEHNSKLNNTLAACADRAPSARSHLW